LFRVLLLAVRDVPSFAPHLGPSAQAARCCCCGTECPNHGVAGRCFELQDTSHQGTFPPVPNPVAEPALLGCVVQDFSFTKEVIGIMFEPGRTTVMGLVPGSEADVLKVPIGSKLVAINGVPVTDHSALKSMPRPVQVSFRV
jgi:hypothetical protein